MSLSTQLTIKTTLETFEFHCGSRRLANAFSLYLAGSELTVTDNEAYRLIKDVIKLDCGLGHLRSYFINEIVSESYEHWEMEVAQGTDSSFVDWLVLEVKLFG